MNFSEFYELYHENYNSNLGTDKSTLHDYVNSYYNTEFTPLRNTPVKLLEIGVHHGGSILLWLEWFLNGKIYGIDIINAVNRNISNAELHFKDAYDSTTVAQFEDNFFDYIIDDGPHSLESQIAVISLWVPKLKSNGKLIIEDIQSPTHIEILENECKNHDVSWKVFDLREMKGRYDDIIFEVTKQ